MEHIEEIYEGGRPSGSVFLIISCHKCLWEPKGYPYTPPGPPKKNHHPAVYMEILGSRKQSSKKHPSEMPNAPKFKKRPKPLTEGDAIFLSMHPGHWDTPIATFRAHKNSQTST